MMVGVLVVGLIFLAWYIGWRMGKSEGERLTPPRAQPGQFTAPQTRITEIRTGPRAVQTATPQEEDRIVIRPIKRPYWEQKGWKPNGDRLIGFYETPMGLFQGYIEDWRSRRPQFYIIKPPRELRYHNHWACFREKGNNLFWVHFGETPTNPDAGILEIEKVLAEALSRADRR